mmetsp:Transcript_92030/g.233991  ORF Transcript_92030/g.233991 Transcript_92030/m.233991 type:complete len:289 (+) Transcript_92030:1146-2012(+)
MMITFAFAIAANSSPRLFVSDSKSSALVMHSWCKSALAARSAFKSVEVVSRSPSAVALASLLCARPILAASRSLFAFLISSDKLCFNISKFWRFAVSVFLATSSWLLAFSERSFKVPTMFPLWLSYTAASGAPGSESVSVSESWLEVCTSAASLEPSAALITEASTMAESAEAKLLAFFTWSMDAPPLAISRSKMPVARSSMLMVSTSSDSSAEKSARSLSRISVAALRSASSVAMSPAKSSILAVCSAAEDVLWAMEACKLSTSAEPVLISWPNSRARSSHHSEYSS